jgi:hypothetical protein
MFEMKLTGNGCCHYTHPIFMANERNILDVTD